MAGYEHQKDQSKDSLEAIQFLPKELQRMAFMRYRGRGLGNSQEQLINTVDVAVEKAAQQMETPAKPVPTPVTAKEMQKPIILGAIAALIVLLMLRSM